MSANRLRIGLWHFVLMATLVLLTGQLVTSARDRVTESTLSATAESTARTWYQHYFHHMHATKDFSDQVGADAVQMPQLKDADRFGTVFRYALYDARGRLVLASRRPDTGASHAGHDAPMPRDAAIPAHGAVAASPSHAAPDPDAARRAMASGRVLTRVSSGWKARDPAEHYAISFIPIRDGDRILGAAEIFVDIASDRKTIYHSFRFFSWTLTAILTLAGLVPISALSYSWLRMSSMNKDLTEARDKARTAQNVKSRFLANMSHEIRTPLTGVMGMAELLNESELDDEQHRYATTILNSSSALLTIINDILDFSKIEAGKMTVVSEPFDLHNCVQDAADLLFPAGHSKGVEVCVDFQKDLPAWVIGDEWRLRQCLLNIAGNAIKFTPKGHVTIRVAENPVGYFEISVCDTGIGIPPDKLDAIFREFEQVETSDTRSSDGTGLGLAITRRLLVLMGGDISAQSEVGKGSCFRMSLPLKPARPDQQVETPPQSSFFDPTALQGKTAVIVDDLEINRRILSARLAGFGMTSRAYGSADAALKALAARGHRGVDVIISDHQMPGKTGVDLLKAIRAIDALRTVPFIILSSCDLEQLRQELDGSPVDLYLNKPVRTDLLYRGLCRAMKLDRNDSADHNTDHGAGPAPAPLVAGDDIRVCVAEDNRTNQLIIEALLAGSVSDVRFWRNGQEAVDGYLQARPDLIFMDISMPVKGGLAATTEIRELERQNGIAPCFIVALTAHAMAEDRDRAKVAGMDGFLTKPIRRAQLVGFLEEAAQRLGKPMTRSVADAAPGRAGRAGPEAG